MVRDAVDSLLGLSLPSNPHTPREQNAPELIVSTIEQMPQQAVVIALGPLTNLAEVLLADPSMADRFEMIYVMGGAVDVPGNLFEEAVDEGNDVAEWNIFCDPYAAKVVLHSGAPVTLVPLDATNQAPVTEAFFRRLEANRTSPEAEFVFQVMAKTRSYIGTDRYFFWDPLTAAILADESLGTFEPRRLTVIDEGPESGRTLPTEEGAMVRVCTAVDVRVFEQLFLDVLNGRLA
jgi:pyrimidine-specific ribonucleoside hydrolase